MKEMFGAAVLGLLLLVIGGGIENEALTLAGIFILPATFLWGGLYKTEDSVPLKITFLAIAGALLAVATQVLASGISLGSLLG